MGTYEQNGTVVTTLEKMSNHLDLLAGKIYDVEEELGTLLNSEIKTNNLSLSKFQSLDFTRQSLEDCALLLHLISRNTGLSKINLCDSIDLKSKLKLEATRSLMQMSALETTNSKSGDLDLF
ncbi:MAG: hypothetical protein ABJL72_22310 [Roseobacter sp.]